MKKEMGSTSLRTVSFVVISDFVSVISSDVRKLADGTKFDGTISIGHDAGVLQDLLHRLHDWSEKWQMKLSVREFNELNVGRNHFMCFFLNNTLLRRSSCEDYMSW